MMCARRGRPDRFRSVVLIMVTVKVQMLSQKLAGSIPQRHLQLDTDTQTRTIDRNR